MVPSAFDPCGPLPTGSVVLEASAGTGKTHTIASLAVRYVAEGHIRLPQLLLVTFGRMATSELRDRVRSRLVDAERQLRTAGPHPDDPVISLLADCDEATRRKRHRRLVEALADLDAATITTTHGFCDQMLIALGSLSDTDPDATLLADPAPLRDEIVDDLYLRKYGSDPRPRMTVTQARHIARAALGDPSAQVEPSAPPDSWAKDAVGLAKAVRQEFAQRKQARRLVDYDDLLVKLRDALTNPMTGGAAAARIRERYRVVMVDEFQDTDPVQWKILNTVFHTHTTLVLIGDPKQAIYAFRGADVVTYLDAVHVIDDTRTLGCNWRADAQVVNGLSPIIGETALGDRAIQVRPVSAAHTERRLSGIAPVTLRQITRNAIDSESDGEPQVGPVRDVVYDDVVTQVHRVLTEATIADGDGWRPIRPSEIAVLALRRPDVTRVAEALLLAGTPAVSSVSDSVFLSAAAYDWQVLLTALARPGIQGYEAAAVLTPFVGRDARWLATAAESDRDGLAARFRMWSRVLADHGVAALVDAISQRGLDLNLVQLPDGARRLADIRHIAEVLHQVASDQRLGAPALLEWLGARRAEAETDFNDERARRLETDAEAVQVLTVHAAKGLEFPVVLTPFLWDRHYGEDHLDLRLHRDGERVLNLGGVDAPGRAEALRQAQSEQAGEDLRLAYVALTRASSAVITWWSPATTAPRGPLTRLLFAQRDADGQPAPGVLLPADREATRRFTAMSDSVDRPTAGHGPDLVVETVTSKPVPARWLAPSDPVPALDAARFDREIDTVWRRTSYSSLTASAHEAGHGTKAEPPFEVVSDEPDTTDLEEHDEDAIDSETLKAVASPLADLPAGTAFGTFVHSIMELVDTLADLPAEVTRRVKEVGSSSLTDLPAEDVATALLPLYATPLGPLANQTTLAGFTPSDRLAELEFELPLAPSGIPGTLRAVARLLDSHLDSDDPFTQYSARLTDGSVDADRALRGYLTGSIDAVLRVRGDQPRFLVVDYKTNRLGRPDEALTCWNYRPRAMVDAMLDAHYPLQFLLYSVALHRYLRWRLPGYAPETHLGGGLYLFVRGMAGPATPVIDDVPCGVVSWRPPAGLVTDLSDLLAGGSR